MLRDTTYQLGGQTLTVLTLNAEILGTVLHQSDLSQLVTLVKKSFPLLAHEPDWPSLLQTCLGFFDACDCYFVLLFKIDQKNDKKHARSSRKLLGAQALITHPSSLYLFNLCVSPDARRCGYGAFLLREAEKICVALNYSTISGTVDAKAAHLHTYYSSFGAEIVNSSAGSSPPLQLRFERKITARTEAEVDEKQVAEFMKKCAKIADKRMKILTFGGFVASFGVIAAVWIWRKRGAKTP